MSRLRTALAATVTALLCTLAVAATPATAAEVLTNGGFETGTLAPWSCSGGLGSVVSTPVRTGTHALHGAASTSDNAQCTQTVLGGVRHLVHVDRLGPRQLRVPRRDRRRVELDAVGDRLDPADRHVHRDQLQRPGLPARLVRHRRLLRRRRIAAGPGRYRHDRARDARHPHRIEHHQQRRDAVVGRIDRHRHRLPGL